MICAKCNRDSKQVQYSIPQIEGRVCGNCRQKWRFNNEPGYEEKYKIKKSIYRAHNKYKLKIAIYAWQSKNKEHVAEVRRNRYAAYPDLARDRATKWKNKNPEKVKLYAIAYRNSNKEKLRAAASAWKSRNPDYFKNRYASEITFRLSYTLRGRLKRLLSGTSKRGSAIRDLGCTVPELKKYLESKFQSGMTWENYGFYGWHIDHIKPLASFDLTDREQFLQACHYTNLQPLWAQDNLKKGARVSE